jgi:homoserine kinase
MSFINKLLEKIKVVEPVFNHIKIIAPSTSANLGPGFDVFALALDLFHDVIEVEYISSPTIEIEMKGIDANLIPSEPSQNSAGIIAKQIVERTGKRFGFKIVITKGIPVGKGLGSSGASAAASAFAVDKILSLGLTKNQLIHLASQGEIASSGSPHSDNVSAAILGGFTIIQSYKPLNVINLKPPENLEIAIIMPETVTLHKKTEIARSVIPKTVGLEKVIHNIGHAATIVAGMSLGDVELIGKGMADDIVEPFRSGMIPGYSEIRKLALEAGAAGVAISGAGPSMIVVVDADSIPALQVAETVGKGCEALSIPCKTFTCKPDSGLRCFEG